MAQQVGSGAAPAASETKATPGGASGMTETDPRQNGTEPGPGDEESRGVTAGDEAGGPPGDVKASRVRGWLRRNENRIPRWSMAVSHRSDYERSGRGASEYRGRVCRAASLLQRSIDCGRVKIKAKPARYFFVSSGGRACRLSQPKSRRRRRLR